MAYLPNEILSEIASYIHLPCTLMRNGNALKDSELSRVLAVRVLSRSFAAIGAEILRRNFFRVYLHPSKQSVANFELICKHRTFGPAIEEIVLLGMKFTAASSLDSAVRQLYFPKRSPEHVLAHLSQDKWQALMLEQESAESALPGCLASAVASLPHLRRIRYQYTLSNEHQGFNMMRTWANGFVGPSHTRSYALDTIMTWDGCECRLAVMSIVVKALQDKSHLPLELLLGSHESPIDISTAVKAHCDSSSEIYRAAFDIFQAVSINSIDDFHACARNVEGRMSLLYAGRANYVLQGLLRTETLLTFNLSGSKADYMSSDVTFMFYEAKWPCLQKFQLTTTRVVLNTLDKFLERHKKTLREVSLINVDQSWWGLPAPETMNWLRSLTRMRHHLQLRKANLQPFGPGNKGRWHPSQICMFLDDTPWTAGDNDAMQAIFNRFVLGQSPCGCIQCKDASGWAI